MEYTISNKNIEFINFTPHFNAIFQKKSFTLITESSPKINSISDVQPFKKFVSLRNQTLENNLRVLESYLPEILLAFSIASDKPQSINESIKTLSKLHLPYKDPIFSDTFLRLKMIYFLETLLFADIFSNIWHGDILSNRCYVFKCGSELEYYHYYQCRSLLLQLFDSVYIDRTIKQDSNKYSIDFRLSYTPQEL